MMKGPATVITSQDIVELIAAAKIEVDIRNLRDDVDLFGQGLDSLDMANLELRIEERYGIKIRPEQSIRLRTIRGFVDFVNTDPSCDSHGTDTANKAEVT
jgi:acyl carrier protein